MRYLLLPDIMKSISQYFHWIKYDYIIRFKLYTSIFIRRRIKQYLQRLSNVSSVYNTASFLSHPPPSSSSSSTSIFILSSSCLLHTNRLVPLLYQYTTIIIVLYSVFLERNLMGRCARFFFSGGQWFGSE